MSVSEVLPGEPIAGVPTLTATVEEIIDEGADTFTYRSRLDDPGAVERFAFRPGQIDMVGVFGVGEVPISRSSDPAEPERIAHTIRICGRVTHVIEALRTADHLTLRGPFGRPWPVEAAFGGDLVIVGGGLGMAPLHSAVYAAVRHRDAFRRIVLLSGARDPGQVLYRNELERLAERGVEVHFTVDHASAEWPHREGLITALFPDAGIDVERATVFMCGPEIMMRFALRALSDLGVPDERLWLTMERTMHCAVKLCGHCQLGPYFVCADGPIFRYDEMRDLLEVPEL